MVSRVVDAVTKPILKKLRLPATRFSHWNLRMLDESYRRMNEQQRTVHEYFIQQLRGCGAKTVLEVACGTGWNIPRFRQADLTYFGLDISETAVAMAAMKFPDNRFFNLSVSDCSMYRDGSFDIVYNSAMLEHIGYYEQAISEMVRLANQQVIVLFFEGLSEEPQHKLQFHHWDDAELRGKRTNIFGKKLLFQDHGLHREKGWYMNRYSRSQMESFLKSHGWKYKIFDRDNCHAIAEQTVLVVTK